MEKHEGTLLHNVLRQNGYKLGYIASKIGVSRNTLYNKFKLKKVPAELIERIGRAIGEENFPLIFENYIEISANRVMDFHAKQSSYIKLLESHMRLLELFIHMLIEHIEDDKIKEEIIKFTKEKCFDTIIEKSKK